MPVGAGLENTTPCGGRVIESKKPSEDPQPLTPYREIQVESLTFFPPLLLSLPWVLLVERTKQKLEGKGAPGHKAAASLLGQRQRTLSVDARTERPCQSSSPTPCFTDELPLAAISAGCSFHCFTLSLAHGFLITSFSRSFPTQTLNSHIHDALGASGANDLLLVSKTVQCSLIIFLIGDNTPGQREKACNIRALSKYFPGATY